MNFRVYEDSVMENFPVVIKVDYCCLQYLLDDFPVVGHTEQKEGGWADIYGFGNAAIVTGYAPFGNIEPSYDLCRRYDLEGEKINGLFWRGEINIGEKRKRLLGLINDFIGDAISENEKKNEK